MRTFFPILLALIFSALVAEAITIGQGPILTNSLGSTTDKKGVTWYEEFQDWTHADLRALDVNGDPHLFGDDNRNTARDLIAFYTHDDGTNVYFRADFFDLGFQHEEGGVDVYVAIDCAPGGNVDGWLPDFTDTRWDQQWDVCVGVYDSVNYAVYDAAYAAHPGAFLGSYWRADLDAVEFGITRSFLVDQGWDGSSPFDMVVFTARDGTQSGAGNINSFASDVVDTIEPAITLERKLDQQRLVTRFDCLRCLCRPREVCGHCPCQPVGFHQGQHAGAHLHGLLADHQTRLHPPA